MMPEMTWLGWFHTVLGVLALLSAGYALVKYRIISMSSWVGKIYLLLTVIVAGSALGIYNQGGFGIAHMLAVLTLIAVTGGAVMEKFTLVGAASKYFQAIGYTSTVLFHMIPAITDFLRRLPLGDPFVDSFDDPLVVNFHLAFLALYAVGLGYQLFWLRAQSRALEEEPSADQEPSVSL